MRRLPALFLLSILPAWAVDVTGKWSVTATAPSGREYTAQLELKREGGKLAGSMSNGERSIAIEDVVLVGNRLTYTLPAAGGYRVSFAVGEGSMTGNYTAPDGTTGPAVATRPAPAAVPDVAGKWKGLAKTDAGEEFDLELDLAVEGARISGTVSASEGSAPIEQARLASSELTFQVTTDEGSYRVKASLAGSRIEGSYTAPDGSTGTFTLRR